MDIISYVQTLNHADFGVWYGVDESKSIDENGYLSAPGFTKFTPSPSLDFVKFGGDWGGLWGTSDDWRNLRAAPGRTIVPYIYCLPEHADAYPPLIFQLRNIGFPLVVLDCEFEWAHNETLLERMLGQIDPEQNPTALTGIAWFGGYSSYDAFGRTLAKFPSLLYMPQAYLSELTNLAAGAPPDGIVKPPSTPLEYAQRWLALVLPNQPCAVMLDAQSVAARDPDVLAWWQGSVMPSIWYADTLDTATWAALPHNVPDVTLSFSQSDITAVNTNLGQSLAWCDQLIDMIRNTNKHVVTVDSRTAVDDQWLVQQQSLVVSIESALHTARHLTEGE